MSQRTITLAAVALAIAFSGGTRAADTVEEVLQELAAVDDAIWSVQYTRTTTSNAPAGLLPVGGGGGSMTVTEQFASLHKDGVWLSRRELASKAVVKIPMMPAKTMTWKQLGLVDGRFAYTLMPADGRSMLESEGDAPLTATKFKPEGDLGRAPFSGADEIEVLRHIYSPKLLADAEVSGRPTYVIEGSPKAQATGETESSAEILGNRVQYYIDKRTGVLIKHIMYA